MVKKEKNKFDTFLDTLVNAGMEKTNRWVAMWQQSLRYFFSDQLHNIKKRKNWDWVIVNYIWPSAMQELAKLAKNEPKIIVQPWEQSDADASEVWESILNWLWKKGINNHGMRLEQIKAILDTKIFGYRVSKIWWEDENTWDDKTQSYIGGIRHRLWHPAQFWADSDEDIDEGNCGTERYVTLEWAQARWSDYADELAEQATTIKETKGGSSTDHIRGGVPGVGLGWPDKGFGESRSTPLLDLITASDKMSSQMVGDETKIVKVQEIYFKDYSTKEIKLEEDVPAEELINAGQIYQQEGMYYNAIDGQTMSPEQWPQRFVRKYKKPQFPHGRYVIRVNHVILNPEQEQQIYPYSRWPFIITPHYLLPHMWQGIDGVQMYKDAQDMINISISHLFNNLKQFGDPKIAVETGAVASPPGTTREHYRIGAGAGAIIRLVKGALSKGRFKILDPPQVSSGALALYNLFSQEYKNLQGLQAIAKGEKQPGKMTATEAQWLSISSHDRIALQSLFEDFWVKAIAEMCAEIAQNKYPLGTFVRIVGEHQLLGSVEITQRLKTLEFDVDILPGRQLPFDEEKQIEKYMIAYKLMAEPIANPMLPDMLKILNIPNWKKLLSQQKSYQDYIQFLQLYEGVKAGKIDPREAVQLLTREAAGRFMDQQANPMTRTETKTANSEENKRGINA